MYDIGIPEIKINSRLEDTDNISIRYEAEASERPHYCTNPRCGHQIIPHVHSSKNNLIRDIEAEGKLVFIKNHEKPFTNRMKLYYEKLFQLHRG